MPKLRTSIVLTVLLLAGPAGCAGTVPESAPAAPGAGPSTAASSPASPVTAVFPVTAVRRGGFAGVDDRAEIAADGSVTVSSRGGTARKSSLSPASTAELGRLVATAEFTAGAGTASLPVCNDGFEYEIATPAAAVTVHDCGQPHNEPIDGVLAIVTPLFAA